ncbi:hypothetical protein J3Q64DRAFT_1694360 [Phycomyces blakesleeanus]|uniref:Secreted protein n=1 Tax=Phycomyces blakesleeanus TaxID=4837 RepID=A0ABR3BJ74_PHYBL
MLASTLLQTILALSIVAQVLALLANTACPTPRKTLSSLHQPWQSEASTGTEADECDSKLIIDGICISNFPPQFVKYNNTDSKPADSPYRGPRKLVQNRYIICTTGGCHGVLSRISRQNGFCPQYSTRVKKSWLDARGGTDFPCKPFLIGQDIELL